MMVADVKNFAMRLAVAEKAIGADTLLATMQSMDDAQLESIAGGGSATGSKRSYSRHGHQEYPGYTDEQIANSFRPWYLRNNDHLRNNNQNN